MAPDAFVEVKYHGDLRAYVHDSPDSVQSSFGLPSSLCTITYVSRSEAGGP